MGPSEPGGTDEEITKELESTTALSKRLVQKTESTLRPVKGKRSWFIPDVLTWRQATRYFNASVVALCSLAALAAQVA